MKPKVVLVGAVVIEMVRAVVLFPLIDHTHVATTDFVNSWNCRISLVFPVTLLPIITLAFELYSARRSLAIL